MSSISRAVEALTGAKPVKLERPPAVGYTRAAKWVASLADGRTVFVKTGSDDAGRTAIEQEGRLLEEVQAPFVPVLHGWSADGDDAVLVLEDLSGAAWPPPYPADTTPLFHALSQSARVAAPAWLEAAARYDAEGWHVVAAEPEPFLALGLCSRGWFERAAPALLAAEARADLGGNSLVHFDVWSGNVCFADRGAVLVDWALARRGNPTLDVAFALLSVRAEGAARPAGIELDDEEAWVAYLSGSFAARAPLPLPAWAEPGSTLQDDLKGDLVHALRWAAETLELPPPDGAVGSDGPRLTRE